MSTREIIECEALSARISARQCLINYVKAQALSQYAGTYAVGLLVPCLNCDHPKQIKCSWGKKP
jgi:hypothetical protein